jgi:hypothetical protein
MVSAPPETVIKTEAKHTFAAWFASLCVPGPAVVGTMRGLSMIETWQLMLLYGCFALGFTAWFLQRRKSAYAKLHGGGSVAIEADAMADEEKTFNVTSVNQSGGITAGVVNVGHPTRHVDENFLRWFREKGIGKEEEIRVVAVADDSEAWELAWEMGNFLKSQGYKVTTVGQAIMISPPKMGIEIVKIDGQIEIIIGRRPS